jgi:hypothetical protein
MKKYKCLKDFANFSKDCFCSDINPEIFNIPKLIQNGLLELLTEPKEEQEIIDCGNIFIIADISELTKQLLKGETKEYWVSDDCIDAMRNNLKYSPSLIPEQQPYFAHKILITIPND